MSDATAKPPAPDEQKSELRPANKNPWYLLATLHGEQEEGASQWHFDGELHARNRLDWNRYMATIAPPEVLETARELKKADGSLRILPEELKPFDEEELKKLKQQFRKRGADELPKGAIHFNLVAFTLPTSFEGFWFAKTVSFFGAKFSSDAGFESATFSQNVWFSFAKFSGVAGFVSATFSKHVFFQGVTFSGDALFVSATFSGTAWFASSTFFGDVQLENAKLQSSTTFAYAKFLESPPKFHGASLHEGTQWHGVEWPPAPDDPKKAQQHVYNYERLKQEMERLKKHEDELKFFALEMRAKRVVDGKWSLAGLLNAAYDGLSAYGQSVARPLAILVLSWFFAANFMANGASTRQGEPLSLGEAFSFSASNLLAVLPVRKEIFGEKFLQNLTPLTHVISAGQMIIGLLCLFLIGLALRNRFRMK